MENFSGIIKKIILIFSGCLILSGMVLAADPNKVKLSEIEQNYYGYTYENDSNASRIARLEKSVYGMNYTKPEKDRIQKLYNDLNISKETKQTPQKPKTDIGPKAESGIKYPIVDKLEQKTFKKSYPNDDIYLRLSRLEKQVFKKESTASLNERVDALRSKLLGGIQTAAEEIDPLTEEIVLENGEKYYGNGYENENSNYNYYSYENSKNHIQEIAPEQIANENYDSADIQSYSGQNYDLDVLEKNIFGKRYSTENTSKRLSRLESQVFHRTFSDSQEARIQRLLAVTTAQKTSQEYDSNKWARRLNTGMQIGSILLMVLAMIL